MLLLLQARGQVTAAELAERLEVSPRTVYRDAEALSSAGVPVYTERGRSGGIRLLPGYRTDVTRLTQDEARTLFVLTTRGAHEDLGLGNAARSAILKVMRRYRSRSGPRLRRPASGSWWIQRAGCGARSRPGSSACCRPRCSAAAGCGWDTGAAGPVSQVSPVSQVRASGWWTRTDWCARRGSGTWWPTSAVSRGCSGCRG